MNAQPNTAAVETVEQEGLVELDLECLTHVGGGTPKGTWLTSQDVSLQSVAATGGVEPTPKGTW
ncbi:hypothetical protein [Mitsuaria sp. GD03876]|uniref:hypothetical protein n=1 Tax=Mitsuaria sp. GD03876 TaxID=2975399 RepID=UPI0024490548|nr:hypothetical protein [Mitsuaria sp. GD03876]MDH0863059.1 hypothetical protein [Mitsuaria sp. GD03876]